MDNTDPDPQHCFTFLPMFQDPEVFALLYPDPSYFSHESETGYGTLLPFLCKNANTNDKKYDIKSRNSKILMSNPFTFYEILMIFFIILL
jgi:hypothetical protein